MNGYIGFLLVVFSFEAYSQVHPEIIWEVDANATNLAFSPDGLSLYSGGFQGPNPYPYGNIKKWDPITHNLLYTITTIDVLLGLTNDLYVSPDGSQFISGNGGAYCLKSCMNIGIGFHLFDSSGTLLFSPDGFDGTVQAVSFSHDGAYIAMGQSATNEELQVLVYRTSDGQLHAQLPGHEGTFAVRFSPRRQNLLATGGWNGYVNMWDIETNRLRSTLFHGDYLDGGYPVSLAFSPRGNLLASSGSGYSTKIRIWDVRTGGLVRTLPGAAYGGNEVAFSPDGRYIAAGIFEYTGALGWHGLIRIWQMSDGVLVAEYLDNSILNAGISSIAFSNLADDWLAYTYAGKIKFAQTDLMFSRDALVDEEEVQDVSEETGTDPTGPAALYQSYPNPFNPVTEIRFSISDPSHVRLRVFNIAGEEVAVLLDGQTAAGQHSIPFNGSNFPSGAYIYRLEAGSFSVSKKMILTK